MRGLHLNYPIPVHSSGDPYLNLLARRPGMEIMCQQILRGATVWLTPGAEPDTFEFFYVLSGNIRLMLPEGEVVLETGGSFHADGLEGNLSIEALSDTTLLYVTNKPVYDDLSGFEVNLHDLMTQVDNKDHYTYRHSRNVMQYSVLVAKKLAVGKASIDDLVTASLFHDVGKCYVPDEILNKSGKLTEEEYAVIKRHPAESARLLEPRFGKKVAEIAQSHHERLNGSGYPNGLTKDEISLEGRLIAIIDSFDTMTSKRVYTKVPKTFLEAAEELYSLPHLYDQEITKVLLDMVISGEITADTVESHE